MPHFAFHDQNVFYSASRKGSPDSPPLVLVHGAGGVHLQWPPALRRLPRTTVYAVDLPGHGRSSGPGRERIADYAEAVRAVLDETGSRRGVIGGHSMGGAIAQTFALLYPERIAGLVLVGTGARLRVAPEILQGIPADFSRAVDLILRRAYGPQTPESVLRLGRRQMLRIEPAVLLGDYLACDRFDVREQLGEMRAPALVLCGSADTLTPEKYSRFLAERMPRASLRIIPDAGHMLMVERPAELTQAVREWSQDHLEMAADD